MSLYVLMSLVLPRTRERESNLLWTDPYSCYTDGTGYSCTRRTAVRLTPGCPTDQAFTFDRRHPRYTHVEYTHYRLGSTQEYSITAADALVGRHMSDSGDVVCPTAEQ